MPFSRSMLRQLAPWLPEQEDTAAITEDAGPDQGKTDEDAQPCDGSSRTVHDAAFDVIEDPSERVREPAHAPRPIQRAAHGGAPERDRIESLRQLLPRTSRLEERVDGNSIKGESWEDLAAQFAHVPTEAADLARALYLLDADAMRRVRDRLYALCGFRGGPIEHLGSSLVTATLQAFAAPKPCGYCKGAGRLLAGTHQVLDGDTGEWLHLPRWEMCPACSGTGLEPASSEYVREALRVSPVTWFALLAEPFDAMIAALNEWQDEARTALQVEG